MQLLQPFLRLLSGRIWSILSRLGPIISPVICTLIMAIGLPACAVVAPLSVAGTGVMVSDERTFGAQIDDKVILSRIKNAQASSNNRASWVNVDVTVQEGRVLLTGALPQQEMVDEAVRIAWSIKGVKEVINELDINKLEFKGYARDSLIANQVRARLLVEKNLLSSNYSVAVHDRVVYILGIAQSEEERQKAINVVRASDGVLRVVNHVILRDDPRRWNRV